jgi:GGDEF domain-containing protein/capsular polysaccharide biosynthesis protein
MELKQYARILSKWLWVAAAATLATLLVTVVFTARQPFVYEAEATFVVRPRIVDGGDALKATDTLIRGAEINSTFAGIAGSEIIRDRAAAVVGEDLVKGQGLSVKPDVVAGTNILRITVAGQDPEVVEAYAGAVADETVNYIDVLNDVYALSPLDPPEVPDSPAGPNKALTNILGGIMGLMLGAVLAFVVDYLSEAAPEVVTFEILDPETGVYNEAYFKRRFDQELSRNRHTSQVFTLAMIQTGSAVIAGTEPTERAEIARLLEPLVRPEDLLAHVGDGTFAVILAGMPEHEAEEVLADWSVQIWPATDGVPPPDSPFSVSMGICQYGGDELTPSVRAI